MDFWTEYFKYVPVSVLIGILIDIIAGDPAFLLHPVQVMGKLIEALERILRGENVGSHRDKKSETVDYIKGIFEVVGVTFITGAVSFGICYVAYRINICFMVAVMSIMCWQCIAARSLKDAAMKVYKPLSKGDTEGARKAVAMIVGRDTQSLDDIGIAKAAVETVAENTNDGVICPLFFQMLGGPILSYVYKSVSTMDSMIGYKNDKYMFFGRFAAKTDDVFAFIPARISAILMIAGTALLETFGKISGSKNVFNYSAKGAAKIFVRDRYNHASPNSAQCESVCAGALGLKLAGPASYFGKIHDKQYIGDEKRTIEPEDIRRSVALMNMTTAICVVIYFLIIICAKFR
ncbi:MAG: cobalamin biosynthesis protein CobD [Butyrivibrio sp.]|nr:cobalamin biosynthesis protein CobD [Butyrivibrio sp.]